MMFVYVVTASASAIWAAPRIATSPLVTPPFAALANDGISASSADAPTRAPAPVAAVRVRNCLRSDRPAVPSCSSNICVLSLRGVEVVTRLYGAAAGLDHRLAMVQTSRSTPAIGTAGRSLPPMEQTSQPG